MSSEKLRQIKIEELGIFRNITKEKALMKTPKFTEQQVVLLFTWQKMKMEQLLKC